MTIAIIHLSADVPLAENEFGLLAVSLDHADAISAARDSLAGVGIDLAITRGVVTPPAPRRPGRPKKAAAVATDTPE
tara:strand:- start:257 stop:487 length:231 start_codon:yes stop_codon:yes gene_type:complete